ncbi:MAG: FtsX-like permease family protein, partial [Gemmatimonadaceae bacterium]|nr:FtsX-like permease family protein [Gemmatimonadaceae bacterium]
KVGVDSVMRSQKVDVVGTTPIVTMRIAKINQWTMSQMLDSTNPDSIKRQTWTLRREYRSTYRGEMMPSEKLIAGKWFGETKAKDGEPVAEVSMEGGVAGDLGVVVGDVITWDVQGVMVPTRVTSFREVNWARLEPNFFAVFSPGVLEQAPKQFVLVGASPDARASAIVQREAVKAYPNVSAIDISLIQRTVSQIVEKVTLAIRFLALFSLAIGIPVLFSAVSATRNARIREGVLLKVLGATADKIRRILLAEYALLGALGAASGMVLSFGGAWAVMRFVFKQPFTPAIGPAAAIAGLMLTLAVVIGLLGGRDVFKETPMAALREA